jgi:hypothetical protein
MSVSSEPRQTLAPPSGRAKLRTLAAKLLIVGVSTSICILLLEVAVRALFPYFRPSAQIPFIPQPGGFALGPPLQSVRQATPKGDYDLSIRFNEDGFRDTKNLREATEADWFAVGDSYTIGWGVEADDRFSNRLERMLQTNSVGARVFNIAIPDNFVGYQRLVAYAESRGPKIRHLIVGVCMENDLCDYTPHRSSSEMMAAPGGLGKSKKEAVRRWFKKHSALYIATSFTLQKFGFLRKLLERVGIARDVQALSGYNEWNETVLNTSRDELLKIVSGRDALVLIVPSRLMWQGNQRDVEIRVHEAFTRMLREAGVEVVDPKAVMEASGDPLSYYFKTDPHWNPRGHEIGARELFKALRARDKK